MIPVIVGALGTVSKGVEKKMEKIGNQRKNGLDLLEYSEESWRPEDTCNHPDCCERSPDNTVVKIQIARNDIIMNNSIRR